MKAIDRPVSSTPSELKQLIATLEVTRQSLGDGRKICQPAEKPNQMASRRGLYATRALKAGTRLSEDDIVALRPATSLTPAACHTLIGSRLSRDVAAGAPFAATDIALERAS